MVFASTELLFLMNDGEPVPRSSLVRSDIKTKLTQTLSKKTIEAKPHNRRTKRQIVELSRSTEVSVEAGSTQSNSLFRVLASDRPGLLGMIAFGFMNMDLISNPPRSIRLGNELRISSA